MKTIAIGICTCDRPNLLTLCIQSLSYLKVPSQTQVIVCLVDSGRSPIPASLVQELRQLLHALGTLNYTAIGFLGIAESRNCVLNLARGLDADILAIIDDDEIVRPEWLQNHLSNLAQSGSTISTGPVSPLYFNQVEGFQEYTDLHGAKRAVRCGHRKTTASGNVVIKSVAFQMPVDFDPRLALCGGEDTDYFSRLTDRGASIYKCAHRDVLEIIPASKACWEWYEKRRSAATQQRLNQSAARKRWSTLACRLAYYIGVPPVMLALSFLRNAKGRKYYRAHYRGSWKGLWNFLTHQKSRFYSDPHDLSQKELSQIKVTEILGIAYAETSSL